MDHFWSSQRVQGLDKSVSNMSNCNRFAFNSSSKHFWPFLKLFFLHTARQGGLSEAPWMARCPYTLYYLHTWSCMSLEIHILMSSDQANQ